MSETTVANSSRDELTDTLYKTMYWMDHRIALLKERLETQEKIIRIQEEQIADLKK